MQVENKKRVLMVVGHYPPFVGGAGAQCEKLASEFLQSETVSVEILTVQYPINNRVVQQGSPVKIHWIPRIGIPFRGELRGSTCVTMFLMFFFVLFKGKQFDVIHINQGMEPAVAVVLAARIIQRKTIVQIASSLAQFDFIKLLRKGFGLGHIMVGIVKHADIFVAMNRTIRDELLGFCIADKKIRCVPNGVVFYENVAAVPKVTSLADKDVVVTVGRLVASKNIEFLLRVFKKVLAAHKNAHCLIVGDGPCKAELQQYVRQYGLSDSVTFTGDVTDVQPYLFTAKVFAFPTLIEGQSNALLEALASGLPSVVSDILPHQELQKECDEIILVSPDDEHAWASTLQMLLDEQGGREQRMVTVARQLSNYRLNNVAQRFELLYEELSV